MKQHSASGTLILEKAAVSAADFLRLHSRAGNSVRLAVRAERKHLDAGDPSRSDQRSGDGALGNVLGLQRHHETPGAGAQRTHCRSAAPGVRGSAGTAYQGLNSKCKDMGPEGRLSGLVRGALKGPYPNA